MEEKKEEIRFNQPEVVEEMKGEESVEKQKSFMRNNFLLFFKKIFKKTLKVLGVIAILVVIIYLAFLSKDFFSTPIQNGSEYSAVFLTNGQVYFGKMIDNNKNEIVLNNVYYLQANAGDASGQGTAALGQTTFNLVKLGNELHGPTDELFVNKTQVMFYEYLREDSKVVESIKNLD